MTLMYKNNAASRLKINTDAASPTITLYDGDGALFPQPAAPGDYFVVTLDDRRTKQIEICTCTGRSGDVLTVERGAEDTVAQNFLAGAVVANRFTAGTLFEILQASGYTKPEADAKFIDVAGDVMTGPLSLVAPTNPAHAVSKSYVDAKPGFADAPSDGVVYGRFNATWVGVVSSATYTAADVLAKLLTVDGAGSGVDADLLDGQDSLFFAPQAQVSDISDSLDELTTRVGNVEGVVPGLAPLDSPPFTGAPTAPTPPADDNDTTIANTAWVQTELSDRPTEAPTDGSFYARRNAGWAPVVSGSAPVGAVIFVPANVAPPSFMKLNGATLDRATYVDLWVYAQASGNIVSEASWTSNRGAFSTGDGSTTFRIPDGRVQFFRGWADGSSLLASEAGRLIGSSQAQDVQSHNHTATAPALTAHDHTATVGLNSVGHTHTFSDASSSTGTGSANHAHTYTNWNLPAGAVLAAGGGYTIGAPAANTNSTGAAHTHTVATSGTTSGVSANHTHSVDNAAVSAGTPSVTVNNSTGVETRPTNIALLACIKY